MSDLSNLTGWLFPASIVVTSFIASPHCVGMCGPLIFTLGSNRSRLVSYHIGRMFSYVGLGAASGSLSGKILVYNKSPFAATAVLIIFASLLLSIGWKTYHRESLHFSLLRGKLWRLTGKIPVPQFLTPFVAGFSSVLLPCGHLYTFALGAATTGSMIKGASFMFFFWLGTLPALAFGVHFFRLRIKTLGPVAYKWAAILFVTTGFWNLGTFAAHIYPREQTTQNSQQSLKILTCH